MSLFFVDEQRCNQDGICAAVCPVRIIEFAPGASPSPVPGAENLCINCGHCVAACPAGALSLAKMPVDICSSLEGYQPPSFADTSSFLRARRSIRRFRSKPVEREKIEQLINIARYAPSGHNSQPLFWRVVEGEGKIQELAQQVGRWISGMIGEQPEVASLLHMDRTLRIFQGGRDMLLRSAPALIMVHAEKGNRFAPVASALALGYLELAAPSLGLGACWAGYFNGAAQAHPPLQEMLALPEGHTTYGALMLGYAKFRYHRLPERNMPKITYV